VEVAVHLITLPHAAVEFQGQPTDDLSLADVRSRKPACRHASQICARFKQDGLESAARARDGRHHAPGSAAVNNQVGRLLAECGRAGDKRERNS
jgi:hypothetical protein